MPQQKRKRGRRGKGLEGGDEEPELKRRKSQDDDATNDDGGKPETEPADVPARAESLDHAHPPIEKAFFGMLDDEEQDHFRQADHTLEDNDFETREERDLFLAEVWREADGKELKIAQSQSCSRLMERLIQLSTAAQLKSLFQRFSGNFIHLVLHRFASHCCEALFLHSASFVTEELKAPTGGNAGAGVDEVYVSMENLFLHTLAELKGNFGFLITDRYASHVLRVLLLVLSGEPLDLSATRHLRQSKKKEMITVEGIDASKLQSLAKQRIVPKSFDDALESLISESVAGLDTDTLRPLATHPNANPTLQLLLKLELIKFGKQRAKNETSIIRKLLPDDPITSETPSAIFISGLLYDPVGSHLVEQIVEHAPGKMFKGLLKEFFRERLASLARNEIAGYVVCRLLERMSRDDLYDAHEQLIPTIQQLLQKNRTMVVRTLIERCAIRDIDTQPLAVQLEELFGPKAFDIVRFLQLDQAPPKNGEAPQESGHNIPKLAPADSLLRSRSSEAHFLHSQAILPESGLNDGELASANVFSRLKSSEPVKVHFNVLAQAMLLVPGPLSSLILQGLVEQDPLTLLRMAKDHIVSRTLQAALTTKTASIIDRRKLIHHFYGRIGEMALDKAASHVVDCIWEGTHGLAFIRERIAEELAENEAALRDSQHGRAVWRNWKMDLYKRKRLDWIRQSKLKASNDGFQSFSELDEKKEQNAGAKTPLEAARDRHAAKRRKQDSRDGKDRGGERTALASAKPAASASS